MLIREVKPFIVKQFIVKQFIVQYHLQCLQALSHQV